MHSIETFFGLLFAALAIALLAKRLDQPYPIALVVGGLALSLIPGVASIPLNPDLVLYLLLPPILTEAAFFTSWRDFWRWRRAIFLLAFGLVTATSAVVAALCVYFIPGMSWSAAFVLGAIVSPPDAAAATSITRGLRLPKRVVQIIEGESLVNDAAGLTIYRFAVVAVVTGSFSMADAALSLLWIAFGGAAIGVIFGWLYVKLFPLIKDPEVEVLSSFLISYLPYFVAETLQASGVLATVAAGLVLGWHAPVILSATTRIRSQAVWQTLVFFINVVAFFFIGLELPVVVNGLRGFPVEWLLFWSTIISAGVIVTRFVWVFAGTAISHHFPGCEPAASPQAVTVVAWTGLRGVVSLAAALALPMETEAGLPFPYRNLILLLTFAVILATLLLQGLTLRPLIRRLRLPVDHSSEEEQLTARIYALEKVHDRLADVEREGGIPPAVYDRVLGFYSDRLTELRARLEEEAGSEGVDRPEAFDTIAEQRLWWDLARVEREAVLQLRREQKLGDEGLREIERDLDLMEARIIPKG